MHLARMQDKSRRVVEIYEVMDLEENEIVLHPLFLRKRNESGEDKNKGSVAPLIKVGTVKKIYKLKEE